MKQMMMTLLLCVAAMTAAAQEKEQKEINEKLFDAKVSELAYRLDMTDEQKTKFTPLYRRYCEEMRAAWGNPARHGKHACIGKHGKDVKEVKDGKDNKDGKAVKERKTMTDEERLAMTKRKMERQQQAQAVRMKYVDEFATVLTARQVSRFYEVERKIQQKLMDRKHKKGRGR